MFTFLKRGTCAQSIFVAARNFAFLDSVRRVRRRSESGRRVVVVSVLRDTASSFLPACLCFMLVPCAWPAGVDDLDAALSYLQYSTVGRSSQATDRYGQPV